MVDAPGMCMKQNGDTSRRREKTQSALRLKTEVTLCPFRKGPKKAVLKTGIGHCDILSTGTYKSGKGESLDINGGQNVRTMGISAADLEPG